MLVSLVGKNKWSFEFAEIEPSMLVNKAETFLSNFIKLQGLTLSLLVGHAVKWCKPKKNWIRTNVDVAVPCSSTFRRLGLVGRNSDGLVLMALSTRFNEVHDFLYILDHLLTFVCQL